MSFSVNPCLEDPFRHDLVLFEDCFGNRNVLMHLRIDLRYFLLGMILEIGMKISACLSGFSINEVAYSTIWNSFEESSNE